MTGPTHIALGVSTVWLMRVIPGAVGPLSVQDGSSPGLLVGCAALGALLPDLDATRSTIKYLRLGRRFQPFLWPARVLSRELGHRGPLHSLAGITLLWVWLGLPTMLWLGWRPALALALGMLSHLLGDASTRSGIPFLYPKQGRWHLLPPARRLVTGSAAEEIVFGALLLPLLLLLFSLLLPQQ